MKKGCITLLTGMKFEEMAEIEENAVPDFLGYPELVAENVPERGMTIQFLEQAFEWDQVTYQFYPYFWGRKKNWLDIFPLDDVDPEFADFLRAVAARVIGPVSPPYEDAVPIYIADPDREPSGGGPAPTIDDPLFRSIAAELRRQQGDHFIEREGTLSVQGGHRIITG